MEEAAQVEELEQQLLMVLAVCMEPAVVDLPQDIMVLRVMVVVALLELFGVKEERTLQLTQETYNESVHKSRR